MRLTLRTLLAYLDDTLDSSQVKQIGQKVAESDTAQELIARIKQVTRRRRLTTPPAAGPGNKIDPNTIGEYLENKLSEDEVAEVEQVCLGSDVHLAEVAACHQILTLVLGEPILIPPTSRQRMYGLVKGREAIPFRRPPSEEGEKKEREESYETDETLRLGLPAFRRSSWTSRLVLIGGGLAACALLVLAIFQALQSTSGEPRDNNSTIAAAKKGNGKDQTAGGQVIEPDTAKGPGTKTPGPDTGKAKSTETQKAAHETTPKETKSSTAGESGTTKASPGTTKKDTRPKERIPHGPPSDAVEEVGKFVFPESSEPALLMQYDPQENGWRRLDAKVQNSKVLSGARLVSLPGFKSAVDTTKSGLRLTLWGIQPETLFLAQTPVRESMVMLHKNDALDLDLTLLRGRILIQNPNPKPARVLIRFHNPTNPKKGVLWELTMEGKGTEVFLERWTMMPPGEPFHADAQSQLGVGSRAFAHLIVRKGAVEVLDRDLPTMLKEPPGLAYLPWDSFQGGPSKAQKADALPEWATGEVKLPAELKPEQRKQIFEIKTHMLRAEETLQNKTATTSYESVLTNFMKSTDGMEIILALRCYTALDDLPALIDALSIADPKRGGIRVKAIEQMKHWISFERDHDQKLYEALLAQKFSRQEGQDMMTMLHGFNQKNAEYADTYRMLISYLDSPKLALRQMADYSLYNLWPFFPKELLEEVKAIQYSPSAESSVRQKAQREWERLLEKGKLPPKVAAPAIGGG